MNTTDIANSLTPTQRKALLTRPVGNATWASPDLYCVITNNRTAAVLRNLRLIETGADRCYFPLTADGHDVRKMLGYSDYRVG